MSNNSRYVTVSIPKAIARKIDNLIEVLGYWPSRSAFVREACLEKITGEERRLMELRASEEGRADPNGGRSPVGGLDLGAPVKQPNARRQDEAA